MNYNRGMNTIAGKNVTLKELAAQLAENAREVLEKEEQDRYAFKIMLTRDVLDNRPGTNQGAWRAYVSEEKDNRKYRDYVRDQLEPQVLLEQLAEECCELGKAALKLIRAYGYTENVTPVTPMQAAADIEEEAEDVLALLDVLGLADVDTSSNAKWERWAKRLGYTIESGEVVEGNEQH